MFRIRHIYTEYQNLYHDIQQCFCNWLYWHEIRWSMLPSRLMIFTNHKNCCDERPQEHNSKTKYTVLWETTRGKSFSFGSSCSHVWLHKTLFLIILPCQIQNIKYTTLKQYHIKIIILIWTQQKLLQYVIGLDVFLFSVRTRF